MPPSGLENVLQRKMGLSLQTYTWSEGGEPAVWYRLLCTPHVFFRTYCVPGVPWEGPARQCRRPGWGGNKP